MLCLCRLSREALAEALTTLGDAMTQEEVDKSLEVLTGKQTLEDALPTEVTAADFAQALGFETLPEGQPVAA